MITFKQGGHHLFSQNQDVATTVSEVLEDVRVNGLAAVRRRSRDGWQPASFELAPDDIEAACRQVPLSVKEDIQFCQEQVRKFAKCQRDSLRDVEVETLPGVTLGHKMIPVQNVGCYVPGGRYPLVASAYMSIVTARVAGVENIVAATPPKKGGGWNPAVIYSMHTSGAHRILCVSGVEALAMMAYGVGGIPPVDMLVGPGGAYIIEAKRQLYGLCGIDLIAGPSELVIVADEAADPHLIACDLLGQAEHDTEAGLCLVTTSKTVAEAVADQIGKQLVDLPTREVAAVSWRDNGIIVIADNPDEAIEFADSYAPEHIELHVQDKEYYFANLRNYGSMFVGEETTVAYGDKAIGTNHILPTGRGARYTGGLWVGMFLKVCSYQHTTRPASAQIARVTERMCELEGMPGHAISAHERIKKFENADDQNDTD